MKDVPNKLQCAYCLRSHAHGGECNKQRSQYDESGCLVFKPDERGCIRNTDLKIELPLYHDFPLLNTWCDYWKYKGVDTEIKINRIYGFKWDKQRGTLIVHCNCDYFENEYHENYVEIQEKPKLKVIK